MSGKREYFQPVQFALLVHDATGAVVGGTVSQYDQDGSRRLAESILRVMPGAATVQLHPWMGTTYAASCVEVVRRPASPGPESPSAANAALIDGPLVEPVSDVEEVSSADVLIEASVERGVEPVPTKRRGRPRKVTQEAQS